MNAHGQEGDMQGCRPIAMADGILGVKALRKLLFETGVIDGIQGCGERVVQRVHDILFLELTDPVHIGY